MKRLNTLQADLAAREYRLPRYSDAKKTREGRKEVEMESGETRTWDQELETAPDALIAVQYTKNYHAIY